MRAFHKLSGPLAKLADPRYLVLTTRNVSLGQLAEGVEGLWASFERLRHTKLWKGVRAAVVVLEVTFNRRERTWHPHLNVIFDGPFLLQADVVDFWRAATRGKGEIVWIERADGPESALEIFKYVTKLADIADVPAAVDEFLTATWKLRFLRTYGSLYRLAVEEDEKKLACPDCGGVVVQRLGPVQLHLLFSDANGVLRFPDSVFIERDSVEEKARAPGPEWKPYVPSWPLPVFRSNLNSEVRV